MKLEANKIFYSYQNHKVLDDFSIAIHSGEVVGLQGASGAGKSTIGKILSGYLKPQKGVVRLNNKILTTQTRRQVQMLHQVPELTMNPKWTMEKILNENGVVDQKILQELRIDPKWYNRKLNEISGGEAQRFAIARALAGPTKFIIADEITTMLDAITTYEIWSFLLKEVKRRETGILVISHDRSLLNLVSDYIITL